MLTLLGSFIGFLGSIVPEFFRNFQDRRDKFHELKILELQMKQQQYQHAEKLEMINVQSIASQTENLYKTFYSGNQFVDSFNGIVRPVIALGFFFLYSALKLIAYNSGMPYTTLWNEEDAAIFAGIVSFYFGTRAINKRVK